MSIVITIIIIYIYKDSVIIITYTADTSAIYNYISIM